MSTTKIPVDGIKSPEYEAIQAAYEKLTTLFALDPDRAAMRLFENGLLPDPPTGKEESLTSQRGYLVTCILRHVERDAIVFYKFLGVLNTFGTEANAELGAIHEHFVGTSQHDMS